MTKKSVFLAFDSPTKLDDQRLVRAVEDKVALGSRDVVELRAIRLDFAGEEAATEFMGGEAFKKLKEEIEAMGGEIVLLGHDRNG